MICDNCGYENNNSALCCGLCGKVFRKEVRKEKLFREDKPKLSVKEKFYKFCNWMREEDKPDPLGVKSVGNLLTTFQKENWRGRIGLIILVISFILGYIELQYFHKITNHSFEYRWGGMDIIEGSICMILTFFTGIILVIIYLLIEMIFKIILKMLSLIKRGGKK
ncbi:MAG: hypothetical protein V1749_00405 [Candidatus Desantisbacteria bacterium]